MTDLHSPVAVEPIEGLNIYENNGNIIEQKLHNICQGIDDIKQALAKITPPNHDCASILEHRNQARLSIPHNERSHCKACSEIPRPAGSKEMSKGLTEWHCSEENNYERTDKLKSKENVSVITKFKKQCSKVFNPSRNKTLNDISKECVSANFPEKTISYDEVLSDTKNEIRYFSPACSQSDPRYKTINNMEINLPPATQELDANTIENKLSNSTFCQGRVHMCTNKTTEYEHAISQRRECQELEKLQIESSIPATSISTAETIEHGVIALQNPKKPKVKLIVFGCSGYGKSSIVNSMLGIHYINTKSEMIKTTHDPVLISTIVDKVKLKFVDTPGIEETKNLSHLETITKSLELFNHSFSGVLLVLKYGERFTQQAKSIVKSLKGILGEKVIAESCICVMTHGELFDDYIRQADEPLSFDKWCRQQEHDIGKLFQECQHRCVLFDNKTGDSSKQKDQKGKLISMFKKLKTYKKSDFESTSKQRETFLFNCSLPQITDKANKQIETLRGELRTIVAKEDNSENVSYLFLLLSRIEELKPSVPVEATNIHSEIMVLKREVLSKLNLFQVNEIF